MKARLVGLQLCVLIVAMVGMTSVAQAASILDIPPAGLGPGDTYRIVFVTSGSTNAASADIGVYNDFVNGAATDTGSLLKDLATTWSVIGSTATVSAYSNIGGALTAPIYLLDGTLIANSTADLWSTNTLDLLSDVNLDEIGGIYTGAVYTGTLYDGTAASLYTLGSANVEAGYTFYTNYQWIGVSLASNSAGLPLYGISGVLTVPASPVPEPATLLLLGTGLGAAAIRRRRTKKRV